MCGKFARGPTVVSKKGSLNFNNRCILSASEWIISRLMALYK